MVNHQPANVDEYIASYESGTQAILQEVRAAIREAAAGAEESISYAMPAYKLYGKPLVYFAGFKNHVGLYATPSGHSVFESELANYKQGKGSVKFPLEKPMPIDLIKRIVKYRVNENRKRAASKSKQS